MATSQKALPRGIRNCNPGNIRFDAATEWWGLKGHDSEGFAVFNTAYWGIRALAVDLTNAVVKDGCGTIRSLITHYAPPESNDTDAYIKAVCDEMGLKPDWPIDIQFVMYGLVSAVIMHENGEVPYSSLTIAKALLPAYIVIDDHNSGL